MARLFISLYLFIALSLIGLSAVLERAIFAPSEPDTPEILALQRLFASSKTADELAQLAVLSGLRSQQLAFDSIAWPDETKQTLQQGEVISLYQPQAIEFYAIKNNANNQPILVNLSLAMPPQSTHWYWYTGLFFALLGGLLALWIWPLWRDLNALANATRQIQPDGTLNNIELEENSLIHPIGDALTTMSQQVKDLLTNQRELTGALAHELRTPLARLKFAFAMSQTQHKSQQHNQQDGQQASPQQADWTAMTADLNELEALVQEMLDYASLDSRMPELNISAIPLQPLCELVCQRNLPTKPEHLKVSIQASSASVMADSHFLERALQNLLLNAYRYAQHQIRLDVSVDQHQVRLMVHDDGPGVAESEQQIIFTPFYRAEKGRDRQSGGTGMGLAIVKRIMQWHGGDCWVTSSPLGGACFVLAWPLS